MLQVTNLTHRFNTKKLFEDVNLKLDRGKRYGLIGANGAGKSTFLKILSGEIEQSEGEVSIEPGLKVGVLKQDYYEFENYTLYDTVLFGNKRLYDAIKEKEKLYANGNFESEEVNNRLAELEMICAEEDPTYEVDVKIEKILQELGFESKRHTDTMNTLTTSEKFKVMLAQVLFDKPDILLLDEPTNNLDIHTISWLENRLKNHEGTMVVISHDRHFINAVVTHILDLDFQKIREFKGNYDDWYLASTLIAKQQEMERNKKLKEKEELERFIARFSANASKARQATSRQKQLEKLNIEAIQISSRRDPSIVFKQEREIGNEVLDIVGVSFSYGSLEVFKNLNLNIKKGDKIAIIGPNGIGKSTLCKLIVEELKPTSGSIKVGVTLKIGYFPQNTTEIVKGEETLYEWLKAFNKKEETSVIRGALGRMLFSGEEQEKSVNALSGGEKHRLMISKLMLEEPNFLLLDEPTNHLDLEAIVALGEALYQYAGNVVCVTHDRELIDAFANRIIELKPNFELIDFRGNYEEYAEVYGE